MKKTRLCKLLSLALCAALVCAVGAAAVEGDAAVPTAGSMGPVQVWGAVTKQENGSLLLENSDETDPNREIVLHLGADTPVVDAVSGAPVSLADVKNGDIVYAWAGPAMTLSLPPQASAAVLVVNVPADYAVPRYYQIASAEFGAADAAALITEAKLTATDGETLTVTSQAQLFPYQTKNAVNLPDLRPGAEILVWTDAQGAPARVLVFSYGYRGYADWTADGAVRIDGERLTVSGKVDEENGVLLPIRAVSEALGLDVAWEAGLGAVVRENGQVLFTALPGAEAVTPDGETMGYGACVFENGTTYLPAYALTGLLDLFCAG